MFKEIKDQNMTWKQKLDHIWEYYRLPIIGIAIGLFVVGSIINTVFINPPKKPYVYLAFVGTYIPDVKLSEFAASLGETLDFDKETLQVDHANFFSVENDPQTNMAMSQKLYAMLAARELDVLICTKAETQGFIEAEFIGKLDQFLSPEELKEYEDLIVYGEQDKLPYAFRLENEKFSQYLGAAEYDIGFIINTERTEAAVLAIKEVLGS